MKKTSKEQLFPPLVHLQSARSEALPGHSSPFHAFQCRWMKVGVGQACDHQRIGAQFVCVPVLKARSVTALNPAGHLCHGLPSPLPQLPSKQPDLPPRPPSFPPLTPTPQAGQSITVITRRGFIEWRRQREEVERSRRDGWRFRRDSEESWGLGGCRKGGFFSADAANG